MLTSRKLVAVLGGQVAILALAALSVFGDNPVPDYEKTLVAIGSITSVAIGGQTVIDLVNRKPE